MFFVLFFARLCRFDINLHETFRTTEILPVRNVTEKIFVDNKFHIRTPTRCDAQLQHCPIQDKGKSYMNNSTKLNNILKVSNQAQLFKCV